MKLHQKDETTAEKLMNDQGKESRNNIEEQNNTYVVGITPI